MNTYILKRALLIVAVFFLVTPPIFAGIAININQAKIDPTLETLIIKGVNFDSFNYPTITIGDTILAECEVFSDEITCSLTDTPALEGGTWKVKVSAGNSPKTNAEVDVFNSADIQMTLCSQGDFVECYSDDPATRDIGICQSGYRACEPDGTWSECIGEVLPVEEDCFSSGDEDCDGLNNAQDPDCADACGDLGTCIDGEVIVCVDYYTDPDNCGGCGNVCSAGATCVSSACTCPDGELVCDGTCVDLSTDPDNCGGCGNVCGVDETCLSGQCESICPAGQLVCDGTCVDLSTDPDNCGECNYFCPQLPNSYSVCQSSQCDFVCNTSYADCNPSDGCETNLNTTDNCGGCGNACNADDECLDGVCVAACGLQLGPVTTNVVCGAIPTTLENQGSGFTTSSVVFLNSTPMTTHYIDPGLLEFIVFGLSPGVYDFTVQNSPDCSDTLQNAIEVVVFPHPACL